MKNAVLSFIFSPLIFLLKNFKSEAIFVGNSKHKKDTVKSFKEQKRGKRKISVSSDDTTDSNVSEDEWEEVDFIDQTNYGADPDGTVEVTIKAAKPPETEEGKWARFIRQQVNRKIRDRQINCHKVSFRLNYFSANIKTKIVSQRIACKCCLIRDEDMRHIHLIMRDPCRDNVLRDSLNLIEQFPYTK